MQNVVIEAEVLGLISAGPKTRIEHCVLDVALRVMMRLSRYVAEEHDWLGRRVLEASKEALYVGHVSGSHGSQLLCGVNRRRYSVDKPVALVAEQHDVFRVVGEQRRQDCPRRPETGSNQPT
jgi:hypothetical protein